MTDLVRSRPPAFVFDLDGTLVDSVYHHVMSWQEALGEAGIDLAMWRIHRKIGMSGGLFVRGIQRETGIDLSPEQVEALTDAHGRHYAARVPFVEPLPGAPELLRHLTEAGIPWTIATSGRRAGAEPMLAKLGAPADLPMVTRDEVARAKPDPDLFLAGAAKLGVDPAQCVVVGDSIWDLLAARRAGSLGVGLLSGGYGADELERAHAFRVYDEPADLLAHIDELGVRGD
ncbi:HAD family hydrolase [Embleya hyalina]|uniref:Haloacid dehalogenase n=1 Tax=Embleya hyalina TaxID=516124 RepID=A0A401YKZ5_9ACTN|nr:HAD family hydrolase [Embleya hyalina]GCD95267.1 haloacid dehalogenase [Embleya hyalina]